MDLQMSKRDGLATIEEIRCEDRLSQIPIITLADSAMDSDRDRCLQAGANAYLSKPIRMKQLVALIQQLLP
jgi:CheY-like chemotaxis protein